MAAATAPAVRGAETRHRNDTRGGLIQIAFTGLGADDVRDRHAGRHEQMVDVPARGFLPPQVAGDAGLEVAPGRAGVDVAARREIEFPEAADGEAQGLGHADMELVGVEEGHVG